MWIMAAQFEIRALRLDAARRILGTAIGMCPREKLFRSYVEMELSLGNVDRCRTLYVKHLEWAPANAGAWIRWDRGCRAEPPFAASAVQQLLPVVETVTG